MAEPVRNASTTVLKANGDGLNAEAAVDAFV
jgi:hypothetical protein